MTRAASRFPLLATAALLVVLGGCAAPDGGSPTPTLEPSSSDPASTASDGRSPSPGDPTPSASGDPLTGTLGFSDIEGGCPFLRTDDGTHYEVLYPEGWEVRRDPVGLVSPEGDVVAEEGDEVTVRGRESSGTVSICQIGPIFEATAVVSP